MEVPIAIPSSGMPRKSGRRAKQLDAEISEALSQRRLVLYHGTNCENARSIKADGLRVQSEHLDPAKWYTLAADFDSAAFHSYGCVVELAVPVPMDLPPRKWVGWPWVWQGKNMDWDGTQTAWYALRETLPAKFVVNIHKVQNGR